MSLRVSFLFVGLLLGYGAGQLLARFALGSDPSALTNTIFLMVAGLLLAFLLGPRIERRVGAWTGELSTWLTRLDPRRVSAATAGLVTALLLGVLLSNLLARAPFYSWYINILVTIGLAVFFMYFALQNAAAFGALSWNDAPKRRSGAKVLDTNVIIDGRVLELARSGFLEGELLVPSFVLRELQFLADHADPQRRARGKRGLGVLEELRGLAQLHVHEWDVDGGLSVDDKLIRFTREIGAKLVSNDSNLSKVASLYGLRVLSIHEVALALRPKLAPGESLHITVTKSGQQSGQGVGYLDDGTMIVVEDGLRFKGRSIRVMVLSNVQTSVGRMIFARPEVETAS
ncbi:PIN/TRAM domain-containing protein [Deinococcus peraridilitoris]|uniref:Integral membrane protein (PIN domain superfamily) n=1 Tax=Deinococcus peraridilitoris (strain DSM 19664 / LMG 22246 / CIP 109416 / KR-200) TaxID=937777 RepID=K9ZY20_DEIPD|nr:integral membrane protein (PIN domain superfamily) [Deinococcus peraridilitoris DSM 19664]